jgi:hypothetical protein
LKTLKLDTLYKGQEKGVGEDYNVEKEEGDNPNPFMAVLDTGLARTTTGAKIFAVMKGVADGGISVPHRFIFLEISIPTSLNRVVLVKHAFSAMMHRPKSMTRRLIVIVFSARMLLTL